MISSDDVMVVPFYGALDATQRVMRHYGRMFGDRLHLVGSEGEASRALAAACAPAATYVDYVQTATAITSAALRPLFDTGVQATQQADPQRVWFACDDDMVTESFFEPSDAPLVAVGNDAGGGCYFWNTVDDRRAYWAGRYPADGRGHENLVTVGCVFGFSAAMLAMTDWRPWVYDGCEIGIEQWTRDQGLLIERRHMRQEDFAYWQVKTTRSLNGYDNLAAWGFVTEPVDQVASDDLDRLWSSLDA